MNKTRKIIFLTILLVLFAMPMVMAADSASIASQLSQKLNSAATSNEWTLLIALQSTGLGFKALFAGDIGGALMIFLVGGTAHIVGSFLIVMYLMMFILSISIMKGDEHKRIRSSFSIGIALIAVVTPSVFNIIVKLLGGSFITISIMLFVVFGLIMLFKYLHGASYSVSPGAQEKMGNFSEAKANRIQKKGNARKVEHEEKLSEKLEDKEDELIDESEDILEYLGKNAHTMKEQLMGIRTLISQIAGAVNPGQVQTYKKSILARSSAFTDAITVEKSKLHEIQTLSKDLEILEFKELKLEADEMATLNKIKTEEIAILKTINKKKGDAEKIRVHFANHERELKRNIRLAHNLDVEREQTLEKARAVENRMSSQFDAIESAQTNMVNHLNSNSPGSIQNAMQEINMAIRMEEEIASEEAGILTLTQGLKDILKKRESIDRAIKSLLKKIRKLP